MWCFDYGDDDFPAGTGNAACCACGGGSTVCVPGPTPEPTPPTPGVEAGFRFEGCDGGQGSFQFNLTVEGANQFVGDIPAGQVGLRVGLTASQDLDIRIYDSDDNSRFDDGRAIVAWCQDPNACNFGLLNTPGYARTTYKGMDVEYSGFDGVDGNQGNEYIKVNETTIPIKMTAFAFRTGEVDVAYSWYF